MRSLQVCLVVGDSVSLGYTGPLTALLEKRCTVVHAPFSGDGGACDTNYALQCAEPWLNSTLDGSPVPSCLLQGIDMSCIDPKTGAN